jgi:hypothetical protein
MLTAEPFPIHTQLMVRDKALAEQPAVSMKQYPVLSQENLAASNEASSWKKSR